ncbi:RecT family recombinase [Achromobacter denitrificans]
MSETTTIDQPSTALDLPAADTSTTGLVLDARNMDSMMRAAELMAAGRATVPRHLQGNASDCMAVIMQSMQWGMNPFAVAQKTHVTQGGALGYEAQLVNAVVIARAPVTGRPEFEFIGDWSRVLGRVKEMKSDKGGKYYVADWNKADEEGLGVICRCTLRGESEPREVQVMMAQAYPRFSTQWATDPQQQITYLAVRKWARRYTPDVILGVYTEDEQDGAMPPRERDITPKTAAEFAQAAKPQPAAQVDRAQIIRDLEMIARSNDAAPQRIADLEAAWKDLTKDERAAVGADEIKRLKSLAAAEDATPTQATQEAAPAAQATEDNPFEGVQE